MGTGIANQIIYLIKGSFFIILIFIVRCQKKVPRKMAISLIKDVNSLHTYVNGLTWKSLVSKSNREVWEMPSALILSEGETPTYNSSRATSLTANVGRDQTNPGIRILPFLCKRAFRRAGERVEVRDTTWETVLEGGWATGWPTAWRWRKELGILSHYYFPWTKLWNIWWFFLM
jgi:hypothetical protein